MAEQEQEQNRSEPATPFKLQEARKRGQVAKSIEVNSFAVLCGALMILFFLGSELADGQLEISRLLFSHAHDLVLEGGASVILFGDLADKLLSIYWPIVATGIAIVILASLLQTGPLLSFHPLKPDVKRLNPVAGFKRVFSKRMLFEAGKTLIKMGLLALVAYLVLTSLLPAVLSLVDFGVASVSYFLRTSAQQLMLLLLLVLLFVALLDLAFNRWDFAQQMRMSRREIKEEVKRREGDPQVRAKLRELQKEAVKRASAIGRLPDADVLITNPTRLAIALQYDEQTMTAPTITAKGAGDLAKKMRDVAFRSRIPIVENRRLAQELFKRSEIDEVVPEDLYPLVARVLAWIWISREQNRPSGTIAHG